MNYKVYEFLVANIGETFTNNPNENINWFVNNGSRNKIKGISRYEHQIDVSLESDNELLLIECKKWSRKVPVAEYLTLYGRLADIAANYPNKKVRAVLVTSKGWQSGVIKLNDYYKDRISLFHVTEIGDVAKLIHKAFILGSAFSNTTVNGSLIEKS